LVELGLDAHFKSEDILNVVDGYKGVGYGKSTRGELEYIADVAATTGIVLDPVYTGKAAVALHDMLGLDNDFIPNAGAASIGGGTLEGSASAAAAPNVSSGMLAGKRVLFLHTGGVFGLFDGRMNSALFPGQLSAWKDE
jgi:1-aminocyclopropane-1-carboxylate deaminase/D-cysteine desulfhydrase-like pyridoxal-dependent ACC family enzyme